MKTPLAILTTDLHLSLKPPRCRRNETDWFGCMKRQLLEIDNLAKTYNAPVICAGDIFDSWNAPAELIQFALEYLPDRMYCIPGNHDTPWHNLQQIRRSAYGVLKTVQKIVDLPPGIPIQASDHLEVVGFPWGSDIEIKNPKKKKHAKLRMAVAHAYIWDDAESAHYGATNSSHYDNFRNEFDKFDVVHLGDNHQFWRNRNTVNLGSFMRRKVDDGQPRYGMLFDDGIKVRVHPIESADKDIVVEAPQQFDKADFSDFITSLKSSAESELDYGAHIERYIEKTGLGGRARELIYQAMEETT